MTLNDVEQALRNLITNQPMVSSGPAGEVINNILSIVNAYKNFRFLLQNHPAQDSFKFNALNISQRAENDLSNAICQTLQERGINLMMYMPPAQYAMNPTNYGGFQNVGQVQMPNMNNSMGMGTQVVYNNAQMPQQMQSSYQSGLQYNVPMGGYPPQPAPQGFNPMQGGPRPQMPNGPMPNGPMQNGPRQPMMNNPVGRPGAKLYPRTAAPTQPISFGDLDEDSKPIKPKKKSSFTIPKPVAQPTRVAVQQISKPSNEPKVQRNNEPKKLQPDLNKRPEPPIVVEDAPMESEPPSMSMPVADEKPDTKKAAGRNYLLELLKK